MSEAFSWNKVLGTDEDTPNPAKVEGLAIDPRNGEPVVPHLEVIENKEAHKYAQHLPGAVPLEALIPVVNEDKYEIHAERPLELVVEDAKPVSDVHIDEVLRLAIERKASDIHLSVGLPPMVRLDGEVVPLPFVPMTPQDTRRMIYETLTNEQLTKFEETHELDFAYSVKNLARFRFNVYMQRGSVAAALRAIPTKIPSFETLGLPLTIRELSKRSSGLVLVTGPTGSGKSTTIATMIDDINENRTSHILTIEDPIEYLHVHKKCMVNQREMHSDTFSFHNSLRAVLREDPDIILVGELREDQLAELLGRSDLVVGIRHGSARGSAARQVAAHAKCRLAPLVVPGHPAEHAVAEPLVERAGVAPRFADFEEDVRDAGFERRLLDPLDEPTAEPAPTPLVRDAEQVEMRLVVAVSHDREADEARIGPGPGRAFIERALDFPGRDGGRPRPAGATGGPRRAR